MTFNEESLRKGIQFGLGSQGIWTPELENKMFEEIKNQALSQDAVIEPLPEHECKYCGAMTTQPDEECYRAPVNSGNVL